MYKVLVVDDSALMRSEITKIIEQDPELKVVATAMNGTFVMDKVRRFTPDVVTMDINMPQMDGIEALSILMKEHPLPVIMISSVTTAGAEETMEALQLGAFDFIPKPSGGISQNIADQGELIRQKIKTAAQSKARSQRDRTRSVAGLDQGQKQVMPKAGLSKPDLALFPITGTPIIGIGVSTGGPKTLMAMLPDIPADFPGTILIAQHMPEKFTLSFAKRLDSICSIKVKEAEAGEIIQSGCVYIAPGGKHMKLVNRSNKILLIETIDHLDSKIYKPSVDVLFDSLLENLGNRWLGIMLTGMGSDGAESLTKLKAQGGHTIVESEASCVVFGMPGKVVAMGGAEFILNEDQIINKMLELINK